VRTPVFASGRKIKKIFKEINFDVIHIQMPYSPFLGAEVLKKAPKQTKLVGTFHILPYNKKAIVGTRILGFVLKRTLRRLNNVFATSGPALRFMKDTLHVDGKVLSNPVDVQFYESFKRQPESREKVQIVFLGRFDERKGVRQLLLAYEFLDSNSREISQLTMCGKGPLLDELKDFASKKNLNVKFPGYVSNDEKAQYLSNADIAVFPSTRGESFGIVLVEAMAAHAGVVLGGDNPGYRSVLEFWPQTLFNPDDMDAFVQKLTYYIHAEEQRKIDGDAQHGSVMQYDINRVCDVLEQTYTKHTT
jgi:phosphatidylinositol alpha-mannosyltransferase